MPEGASSHDSLFYEVLVMQGHFISHSEAAVRFLGRCSCENGRGRLGHRLCGASVSAPQLDTWYTATGTLA